ncbi:MAG: hypothetical protein MR638_02695 [Lachnospiraceae bacterium]|nr:hypothetical protein [Lachnospiraceae bacterium]
MTDMKRDFGITEAEEKAKTVTAPSPEDGRIYMMDSGTVIVVGIHYNHESNENADSKVRALILNDILREHQREEGEA